MELIVAIVTAFTSFVLGLFILLKNRRSGTHIYFAFLLFCISLYPIFNYLALTTNSQIGLDFFSKMILFSAIPAGPFFFCFVKVFPTQKLIFNLKIQALLLLWVLLNFILAYMGLIFSKVSIDDGSLKIEAGPAVLSFMMLQVGAVLGGVVSLIRKYRLSKGYLRQQLQLIAVGISISLILMLLATVILPLIFDVTWFVIWSPLFLLLGAVAIASAIGRYQLLDIRPVLARTVSYFLILIIFAAFQSIFLFLFSNLVFGSLIDLRLAGIFVLFSIVVGFTLQPLKRFLTKTTDNIFYQDYYDFEELLHKLTLIMASTLLLEDLCRRLLQRMLSNMKISRGMIILIEENEVYQVISEGYDQTPVIDEKEIGDLLHPNELMIYESLNDTKLQDIFKKYQFELVIEMIKEGQTIGLITLGGKLSGDPFSNRDAKLVNIIASEAAVAIENAKAYEEIRRFNVTLEDEIDRATGKLVSANKKLQELDKLKDEFVSIASHELRTPMVSIKNYIWMTLAGKGGKLQRKQKFYLDRAYASANRMSQLINDLLNISRIESGRIVLNIDQVNIGEVVEQIVGEFQPRSEEHGVQVTIECPTTKTHKMSDLPDVMVDRDKISEVLTNLIGNALKFTPSNGKVRICLTATKQFVTISVIDTGVGLNKDQMTKLFKKFGMLKESYASNGDAAQGTGLGLYISKSIVELHGGKIWVESDGHGKGSTFSFTVPVYTEKELKKIRPQNGDKSVPEESFASSKKESE